MAAIVTSESLTRKDFPGGEGSSASISSAILQPRLTAGLGAIVLAILLALLISLVQTTVPGGPERRIVATGAMYAGILLVVGAVAIWQSRGEVDWLRFSLLMGATLMIELVATYFFWSWSIVQFPADILLWSESEFVGDIIKLQQGYPLYTAPANLESFTYTPGAQTLTWLIASVIGKGDSIPVYRAIQIGFALLAAVVAFLSLRRVLVMTGARLTGKAGLWGSVLLAFLFLMATNLTTNQFVQFLHNDSLALLITMVAYWLLLKYVETRSSTTLVAMALVPALGFMVKQSLLIWAVLYGLYLLVFDRAPWRRLILFGIGTGVLTGAVLGTCYLLWGENFWYWTFTVMGNHAVSPLRSFQHALAGWGFFLIAIVGGLLALSGSTDRRVLGTWVIGLLLLTVETYSSGVAWMLNHMGPGCLIAAIWLGAAMARHLPAVLSSQRTGLLSPNALRAMAFLAVFMLMLGGLGTIRIPEAGVPADATRYMRAIEQAAQGRPREKVLLDMGSWLYLPDRIVMKDRGAPAGEAGYTGTVNFDGFMARIATKEYDRILVRDLHTPVFNYDYALWGKSSGVRNALLEHYRETATIPAVDANGRRPPWFGAVSVLEPR